MQDRPEKFVINRINEASSLNFSGPVLAPPEVCWTSSSFLHDMHIQKSDQA